MKTEYQYIRFVELASSGKTTRWDCQNRQHGHSLGTVRWSGAWRSYVYDSFPAQYSAGCHRDIADFLDQLMRARTP